MCGLPRYDADERMCMLLMLVFAHFIFIEQPVNTIEHRDCKTSIPLKTPWPQGIRLQRGCGCPRRSREIIPNVRFSFARLLVNIAADQPNT
jgi:hypothetical protein